MSATCFTVAGKFTRKDVNQREYSQLVSKSLPHVIQNEAENEHYIRTLEILDAKSNPTPAEKTLADLLTMLIENFEEQHYALRKGTPTENLVELMQAHHLKQRDLIDVFGTPSIVSEVLSGKRRLATSHIRKLSERFHVPAELFL
jgi:HTH-type transcriptional regulator/antitoxin HigA